MENKSKPSELEALVREAVELQARHSSPKAQALLNLLSKDTSSEQLAASTNVQNKLSNGDQELIAEIMKAHPELTFEEVQRNLELFGGL